MRVLHVGRAPGGVGTHIMTILAETRGREIEHLVLASSDDGPFISDARELGAVVFEAPMPRSISPVADVRALARVIQVARTERPDLIHAHSAKGGALGRLAGALSGIPVVFTPNAFSYLPFSGLRRVLFLGLEKILRPLTTVLVACSPSEASRAIDEVGFPAYRVVTIPNSLSFTGVDRPACRSVAPLVLMVGRLSSQKNPEQFFRSYSILKERGVRATFRLIGAGYLQDADLAVLRSRYDPDAEIDVVPWLPRDQLLDELSLAAVLAMPSAFEGLPYIALEAMQRGVPIVGTKVDGIQDAVDDGTTGSLVPFGDARRMADRIEELLTCPEQAAEFARRAWEKGLSQFEASKNTARLLCVYEAARQGRIVAPPS